jgi:hypothetical protein
MRTVELNNDQWYPLPFVFYSCLLLLVGIPEWHLSSDSAAPFKSPAANQMRFLSRQYIPQNCALQPFLSRLSQRELKLTEKPLLHFPTV